MKCCISFGRHGQSLFDWDTDINCFFYFRITMIDEMLLFNRHDEINLDALKVIKEKKRYKMDKIKKHFNFQTLEDPIMSPSAEMTKFMTKYLTGIVLINSILRKFQNCLDDADINVEYYECGHLCTVPHLPMVRVNKVILGRSVNNYICLLVYSELCGRTEEIDVVLQIIYSW